MQATLRTRSWLRRVLEVRTEEGWFLVEYNGRGFGYESVWINDEMARAATSFWWFVPRFDFALGPRVAEVQVRVWPWLAIRSFRLTVGDEVLYAEGWRMPALPEGWQERFGGPVIQPVHEDDPRLRRGDDGLRR